MPDSAPDLKATELALADELMRLHCESYGKGASVVRVHILDDTVLALFDEIELLPNEEFMVGAGKGDAVLEIRSKYQQAIETTFRAAVERATGRTVVSFASNTKLDPNWCTEIFRLGPRTESTMDDPRDA